MTPGREVYADTSPEYEAWTPRVENREQRLQEER